MHPLILMMCNASGYLNGKFIPFYLQSVHNREQVIIKCRKRSIKYFPPLLNRHKKKKIGALHYNGINVEDNNHQTFFYTGVPVKLILPPL